MRLFFAVGIPDDIRTEWAIRAAAAALSGVTRSRADGLHVTLRFLGETPASRLDAAVAAGNRCTGRGPFGLGLSGAGTFPDEGRPHIFWSGVTGDLTPLGALASALEEAVRAAGFPPEERTFSPHLTLARARKGVRLGLDATQAFRQAMEGPPSRRFDVDAFHLYESRPGPTGARYEIVKTFFLT